jgi:crotonobetainyl-CoA:carnitine CoA-transferase CaiB-like acyl-CoA transferase
VTPIEKPRVIGPALADAITGQYAAMGILAALVERGVTGNGRRLDISMLEAMTHFNLDSFTHFFSVGEVMGPLSRPVVSQSYTFECADGKWVAIHMSSPRKFWEGLLEATERLDLDADPRFHERLERIRHQDALIEVLTPVFRERSRDEWCDRLLAAGVPHAPAYDSNEALEDPQAVHLGLKVSAEHPQMGAFTTVRPPYAFDGETDRDVRPPPTLDEHGPAIRAELAAARSA